MRKKLMKKFFMVFFVLLIVSSCVSYNAKFEDIYWRLFSIEGDKITSYDIKNPLNKNNPHLIFQSRGRVSGNTGCNIINARFDKNKNNMIFVGVVTSKNQCSKEKKKIEDSFVSFLQQSEYMIVNGNTLTIYNKNKDITLIFNKENPSTIVKK